MVSEIAICLACEFLFVGLWIGEKNEIALYDLQFKAFVSVGMVYMCGMCLHRIVNTVTQIYIYEWGMKILFWGYEKKIRWEEFVAVQKCDNHFVFQMLKRKAFFIIPYNSRFSLNISKRRDPKLLLTTYHPFTSFVIYDKSEIMSANVMPLSADEFCDLLTSYGVKYTESK